MYSKALNEILNTQYKISPINNFTYKATVSSGETYNQYEIQSIIDDYIAQNWSNIKEKAEDIEAKREHDELVAVQKKNKYERSRVKHVHWSGNTCVMYWSDGTQTKSHWDNQEDFDPEKAMLVCMARKLFDNTSVYNEILKKYEEDGWDHFEKAF